MDIKKKYRAFVGEEYPEISHKLTDSDIEKFAIEFGGVITAAWKNKSDEWIYERLNNELKDKVAELYKDEAVKNNVALADVSNKRELLIAFAEYSENDKTSEHLDELVDNYLDSIK